MTRTMAASFAGRLLFKLLLLLQYANFVARPPQLRFLIRQNAGGLLPSDVSSLRLVFADRRVPFQQWKQPLAFAHYERETTHMGVVSNTRSQNTAVAISELGPWFHNLHLPDGTQTAQDHCLGDFPRYKWEMLAPHIPEDLRGWRALDLQCHAGSARSSLCVARVSRGS